MKTLKMPGSEVAHGNGSLHRYYLTKEDMYKLATDAAQIIASDAGNADTAVLEKMARTRWQKELPNMSPQNRARLGPEAALADAPVVGPAYTKATKARLFAPATDLTPDQLGRHRRLAGMQAKADLRSLGGTTKRIPILGPSSIGGDIAIPEDAGTSIRAQVTGKIRSRIRPTVEQFIGKPSSAATEASDKVLQRSITAHEGAEKALQLGAVEQAKGGKTLNVPSRAIATHMGAMPVVEEQSVLFRDPQAKRVMEKVRQIDPDDRFLMKKMKQYGATPSVPMPTGGRAHSKLERLIAHRTPRSQAALANRGAMSAVGSGFGSYTTKNAPWWARGLSKVSPNMRRSLISDVEDVPNIGARLLSLKRLARK